MQLHLPSSSNLATKDKSLGGIQMIFFFFVCLACGSLMFNHCRGVSGLLIELLAMISAFFFPFCPLFFLITDLAFCGLNWLYNAPLVLDLSNCNFIAFTGASSFKELKLRTQESGTAWMAPKQEEDAPPADRHWSSGVPTGYHHSCRTGSHLHSLHPACTQEKQSWNSRKYHSWFLEGKICKRIKTTV